MFLKSLTLKGFKSFAEHTTLDFEPGVTVVVGPNGSGKSNLVDAVAWVLGAQSTRSLRSTKMDDVIFAGSGKRPALGRAEVSLTIDNSTGLLPIEFTEVTITRTLFRSGDSEYAINGVPCRLLDIQDMLSDTGVGRQQHVIVSQGQLDAVLNARPEDRRTVIEEAAGVLKYRRRKEKAERRLEGTEANLVRLQDLLREVRRQLRPLERQAEAARRHGEVAAELGALQLYLAGREVAGLRARATAAAAARAGLNEAETALKARLARLDADVVATEAALSAAGGDELGDALARVEALRERARGLAALLAERRRSAERERATSLAGDVVAALDADDARLRTELAAVGAEASTLTPRADELARAERGLADERGAFEEQWGNGVPMAGGEAAEVRGELSARRAGLESGRTEMARLEARLAGLEQRASRLDGDATRLRAEIEETDIAERALAAAAERAAAERAEADTARAEAESGLRGVEAERQAWSSRAERWPRWQTPARRASCSPSAVLPRRPPLAFWHQNRTPWGAILVPRAELGWSGCATTFARRTPTSASSSTSCSRAPSPRATWPRRSTSPCSIRRRSSSRAPATASRPPAGGSVAEPGAPWRSRSTKRAGARPTRARRSSP